MEAVLLEAGGYYYFFWYFSYLPSSPDLPPFHLHISLLFDIPLLSHPIYIPPSLSLCQPLPLSLVPCFKDTSLLKWKAGLSLDIIANIGPVE